jgi:hypothetical protein
MGEGPKSAEQEDGDVMHVDRARLRRFLLVRGAWVVAFVLLVFWLNAHFHDALSPANDPIPPQRLAELRFQIQLMVAGAFVLIAFIFFTIFMHGVYVVRYRRVPVPGAMVLRERRIKRGRAALWRGIGSIAIGVAGIVAIAYAGWWLVAAIARDPSAVTVAGNFLPGYAENGNGGGKSPIM